MNGRPRFYKEVSVGLPAHITGRVKAHEAPPGYSVLLDRRPVKTPMGAVLALPNASLAHAVAEEWRGQGEKIIPSTMHLTRLANTAIDRVGPDRAHAESEIVNIARTDVLCYRATEPESLVARQRETWDPLLAWAEREHSVTLVTGAGIGFVEQPDAAMESLRRLLALRDAFQLAGLVTAATLCTSAILALAIAEGAASVDDAFAASNLDAEFQAERWGRDAEAEANLAIKKAELVETARFIRLSSASG